MSDVGYWKIYLINKELLHVALRSIGCDRNWFYSDEFYSYLLSAYNDKVDGHYVIIHLDYIILKFGDIPTRKWDYDYDSFKSFYSIYRGKIDYPFKSFYSIYRGKIDYRRKLKLEKICHISQ